MRSSARGGWGWDEPELFEQQQPVIHQIEQDMTAVAEAEYLEVIQGDRAAGGRDIAGRAAQDAIVRSGEGPSSTATSPAM